MPANRQRKLPPPKVLDQLSDDLKIGKTDVDRVGAELGLNPRQIQWAKLYAANAHERNVQRITMEVYPKANYNSAAVQGSQLMRHPCILAFVDIMYVAAGVSDLNICKNIVEAMNQSVNYPAKIQAARTLLEAKGKLKEVIELNVNHSFDFSKFTTEELQIIEAAARRTGLIEIEGRTVEDESGISNGGTVSS